MNLKAFGLDRDPFAISADEELFVSLPVWEQTLTQLEGSLQTQRGIGILTGGSGLGKTTLCRELLRRVSDRMLPAHLEAATFTTRRGLLQAILYELSQAYEGLSEQEARLRLIDTIRGWMPHRMGLALVVDEAERLNDRMLEELRGLSNYEHEGIPLVRLILCGDIDFEERLADPALESIRQRIHCHEILDPLTQEESARFLDRRIMWAGGDGWEHLFTRQAMELICLVSDGSPRCLEQLASRSLQRAAVLSREPMVQVEAVREALDMLKELPLRWNEPSNLDVYVQREQLELQTEETPPTANADELPDDDQSDENLETELDNLLDETASLELGAKATEHPIDDLMETADWRLEPSSEQEDASLETSIPEGDRPAVVEFGVGIETPETPPLDDETGTAAEQATSDGETDLQYLPEAGEPGETIETGDPELSPPVIILDDEEDETSLSEESDSPAGDSDQWEEILVEDRYAMLEQQAASSLPPESGSTSAARSHEEPTMEENSPEPSATASPLEEKRKTEQEILSDIEQLTQAITTELNKSSYPPHDALLFENPGGETVMSGQPAPDPNPVKQKDEPAAEEPMRDPDNALANSPVEVCHELPWYEAYEWDVVEPESGEPLPPEADVSSYQVPIPDAAEEAQEQLDESAGDKLSGGIPILGQSEERLWDWVSDLIPPEEGAQGPTDSPTSEPDKKGQDPRPYSQLFSRLQRIRRQALQRRTES